MSDDVVHNRIAVLRAARPGDPAVLVALAAMVV